jgi:hypothetical protein
LIVKNRMARRTAAAKKGWTPPPVVEGGGLVSVARAIGLLNLAADGVIL